MYSVKRIFNTDLLGHLFVALVVSLSLPGSLLVELLAQEPAQKNGLYTIELDGGEPTFILSEGEFKVGSPVWSPDGAYIAYDTWGPGGFPKAGVFVVRKDGTERVSLGFGGMPTWSPDGKRIAFHTYRPSTIVVTNRDGSERTQVLSHWGNPRWMADPNKILSIKGGGLAIFDFTTGKETTALDGKWKISYGISLSPDNKRVAFRNRKENKLHIATLGNVFDEPKVTMRLSTGNAQHSSWSPDAKELAIEWKAPGNKRSQIYILDADSDDEPVLLDGQDAWRENIAPTWSPDGKTIAYVSIK